MINRGTFTRFDIPVPVSDLLQTAVDVRILDLKELYACAVRYGDDWAALTDEVCAIAFASRQDRGGAEKHAAVVQAADRVTKWRREKAHAEAAAAGA